MNIPYLVGRRPTIAKPVTTVELQRKKVRIMNGGSADKTWSTLGWSVATFSVGAILGWMASGNVRRKGGS